MSEDGVLLRHHWTREPDGRQFCEACGLERRVRRLASGPLVEYRGADGEWREVRPPCRGKAAHRCPPYCHYCPDLGGEIMPGCYGGACSDQGLDRCTCDVEAECARELARRMLEYARNLPPELARLLAKFRDSPVRMRHRRPGTAPPPSQSPPR